MCSPAANRLVLNDSLNMSIISRGYWECKANTEIHHHLVAFFFIIRQ